MCPYAIVNTAPIIEVLSRTVFVSRFITLNSLRTGLSPPRQKEKISTLSKAVFWWLTSKTRLSYGTKNSCSHKAQFVAYPQKRTGRVSKFYIVNWVWYCVTKSEWNFYIIDSTLIITARTSAFPCWICQAPEQTPNLCILSLTKVSSLWFRDQHFQPNYLGVFILKKWDIKMIFNLISIQINFSVHISHSKANLSLKFHYRS